MIQNLNPFQKNVGSSLGCSWHFCACDDLQCVVLANHLHNHGPVCQVYLDLYRCTSEVNACLEFNLLHPSRNKNIANAF